MILPNYGRRNSIKDNNMKWLKLVGLRFLDFIITSTVIILICVGIVNVGEHYLYSTREKVFGILEELKQRHDGIFWRAEIEAMLECFRTYSGGQIKPPLVYNELEYERLKRQLDSAIIIHHITKWIILPIALFAVVSVLGISLRPKGLTQGEGFVRVWAGVPGLAYLSILLASLRGNKMLRLFLLSMAFFGAVVLFIVALVSLTVVVDNIGYLDRYLFEIILGIPSFIIGCAGIITLGIMLVKRIIGLIKK